MKSRTTIIRRRPRSTERAGRPRPSLARTFAALGAATFTAAGVLTAVATPASAVVVSVDNPLINTANRDFGFVWSAGAPQVGSNLGWDVNAAGNVRPRLNGNLYLRNGNCGRIQMQYFNAAHVLLATRVSAGQCAPGAANTAFPVAINSFADPAAVHVHVNMQAPAAGGGWVTVAGVIEDL